MTNLRKRSEEIRAYILENVENDHKRTISLTTEKFNISRQAVHRHIKNLVEQGLLIRLRNGEYELCSQEEWAKEFDISDHSAEDVLWRNEIKKVVGRLPDNTIDIWQYGFTEMLNNVVEHSESKTVLITISKNAYFAEMSIVDKGVGIFNKIKNEMDLLDERHAVLELTKGKLTTDPEGHTGEGIFFTSRMFDTFSILSGEVYLSHTYGEDEDWVLQTRTNVNGTIVTMRLKNNTSRTTKEIFDEFASDSDFGFTKTIVPVRLAQYGDEKLISRSQAKRLLSRIDRFMTVIFDFKEVESIGKAFADEVFRVFANEHPNIKLFSINTNDDVLRTIESAKQNINNNQGSLF